MAIAVNESRMCFEKGELCLLVTYVLESIETPKVAVRTNFSFKTDTVFPTASDRLECLEKDDSK